MDSRTGFTVLGALAIAAAFVFGIAISDSATDSNTPLITTVLGFFGLFIMSAIGKAQAAKRSEQTQAVVEETSAKVDRVLNGEMDAKIAAVVHNVLDQRGIGNPPPS